MTESKFSPMRKTARVAKEMFDAGMSPAQIAESLDLNRQTIYRHLRKSGAEVKRQRNYSEYEYVRNARKRRKQKAIDYKGGSCVVCGYDRCSRSLDFHHLDPSGKDFNVSRNLNMAWDKLKIELDKCVLVCSNCHGEIHEGLIKI